MWYKLRPHDGPVPFSLAHVPTEVPERGANGFFRVGEPAAAVRAALKEWLGWAGWRAGLPLAADRRSRLGSAAGRSFPSLSVLWADLHWGFRARDDREVIERIREYPCSSLSNAR